MSVTIGLLITLGVQAGVALANQKWNSENAKAIRDIQRAHKKDAQNAMLRRDREKYERARELQMRMEFESQQERIRSLNQDFLNSFKKMAHNATLASHYPLKVSPYVISKTVLPISDAQLSNTRQEVLCILTTSNNNTFNKEVLPYIDEMLSQAVAHYWNGNSLNNVCYYQGMWDYKKDYYEEDIENVKAVINSPTLTLTPFFVMGVDGNHHLYLKVRLWGMECDCCELADTGFAYPSLPLSYNMENIQTLLADIFPLAICVVGQLVDVFYWTIGNQPPVLPHLVASGAIPVSQKFKSELAEAYAELYMTLSLGCGASCKLLPTQDSETLQHNAMTSLLNFPERSIDFLRSCIELTKNSDTSDRIIESAAQAIYHAHTEEGRLPIPLIDVRRLDYDDMALVTTLIDIAHKSGNTPIAKQLATLINRKIVLESNIDKNTKNDIVMDEDMIIAQQLLSEANEKLNLLKNNAGQLPVREVLVLASSIREKLRDNQTLTNACDNDVTIAELRKRLLEDIHVWQLKLIEDIVSNKPDDTVLLGQITDFDETKKAMVEMIEAEQAKHIFEETESPKLMEGIADCKKHATTICRVAENCKNGKFLALVLGDFQSGKSTTIDALCDGRHISAIGDGTATSAVLVMVSYGKEESLQIYWREKEQFLPIFDHIKRVMPEYDWVSFDLEKRDERIKLANAIGQIRQRENKSVKGQNLDHGDVKFLMLCDLILAFYGTEVLQAKKASLLSISNISDITRFPKDGETKWKKDGAKGFTIDEAIFVFIDSVACTTPSETLKKLNCTVIDSPGLFNSAYDTMVTESAMVAAHAIIYVLPYHKGIGQDVCGSLYAIKDRYPDVHKKLFIVNNVDPQKGYAFVESNCAFIKAEFGAEKEVYVYDAKMSYLAQLKRRYDMGLAIDTDYAHLMHAIQKTPIGAKKELKFQTFDEAWGFHMNPYKTAYGTNDGASVDTYLRESGFIDMVAALKAFIEKNEAYAVILSNALIPMHSELMAIKRELGKRYIEPYTKSHEEMAAIWSTRISRAGEFQEYSTNLFQTEVFDPQKDKSVCDRLSEKEYKQIFTSDFYTQLATGIAEVLYDNKSKFLASQAMRAIREDTTITLFPPRVKFKDNGQFQKVFGDLVTPLIKEKICELISGRMKYILEMIETGQDSKVSTIFTPVADKIKLRDVL